MQFPSVLLVEDDAFQRKAAETYLSNNELKVTAVENGARMRRQIARAMPDLVLLDVQLPGPEDGFALARWLRESSPRVGIIMLTAAADPVDKVLGLESGADDYVAKPYEPRELLARCKSVLRRSVNKATPSRLERIRMGGHMLDLSKRQLLDGDKRRRAAHLRRVRHPEDLCREPEPAAVARLAAGDDQPPRPRPVRPRDRPADHPHPAQDRAGARQADRHPHRAGRRLYVRAARRIAGL
jgi:DNA-binding response OmpR family regulator